MTNTSPTDTYYCIRWRLPDGAVRENRAELYDSHIAAQAAAEYMLAVSTERIAPLMRRWYSRATYELIPVTMKPKVPARRVPII